MSDSELFARYGSDLTVPSLTTYRFIYTNETEKKKLLTFITKHHTSFRQDWPVEVTQTEDTVTVWIAGKLAFNYEGIPVSCWAYYDNCKREGDYAIIKKGLKNYHPWSSLWFRLPLRRLPIAKVLLSYRPENYLPWKSYSIDNEYLGKRIDRLISTPSGLQILHSEADYADFHSCPLIRKKLSTSLLFCEPAVLNIPNQNAEPDPNQNPDPNANPGPNQEIVVMNQEQLLAELQRLRDGYAALDRGTHHLNAEEFQAIKEIALEFCNILFIEGQPLTFANEVKQKIITTCDNPINVRPYQYPFALKEEIRRTLNAAETNYSALELETLGILFAVKSFRAYLYGRRFILYTDHRPLVWLFSMKEPNSKIIRWRLQLEEYDFEIRYKPGRLNINADALSRVELNMIPATRNLSIIGNTSDTELESADESETIRDPQPAPPRDAGAASSTVHSAVNEPIISIPIVDKAINLKRYQVVFSYAEESDAGLKVETFFIDKVRVSAALPRQETEKHVFEFLTGHVVPSEQYGLFFKDEDLFPVFSRVVQKSFNNIHFTKFTSLLVDVESKDSQLSIIRSYHLSLQNHRGILETEMHLSKNYYWPNMRESIQNFINDCELYNLMKYDRNPIKLKFNKTPTPNRPF
ncbi:uncharacterized protein [Bemisia tabaci]|uniref:uncharacterized protein n=1 Tax=Bemisia tabaci TaxID=7038 RepID=UPI003B280FDD